MRQRYTASLAKRRCDKFQNRPAGGTNGSGTANQYTAIQTLVWQDNIQRGPRGMYDKGWQGVAHPPISTLSMTEPPSLIFDRALLRQRQTRRQQPFFLSGMIADNLAERLQDIARGFETGCAIGLADQATVFTNTQKISHLYHTENHWHPAAQLIMDDEYVPLREVAFDIILSALNLAQVNDVPGALLQLGRALKPDSLFLGALLGGETLQELRHCLAQAEDEITGGVSPRVAPMIDVPSAAGLLQRAGFALPVADHDIVTVEYPDMFALLRDLRGAGLSSALLARRKNFTPRAVFLRAAEIYMQMFASPTGITATFNIIYLAGWRPAASQQQPLTRGSAQFKLADALSA